MLLRSLTIHYGSTLAVITGAMLIAIQTRLRITAGKPLGQEYSAYPLALFALMGLAVALAMVGGWGLDRSLKLTRRQRFAVLMVSLMLTGALALALLPDVSMLQLAYFGGFGVLLGAMTIAWPPLLTMRGKPASVMFHLRRLWENRVLLRIWVIYNIRSRYSQTILGIAWIILLPLGTSSILAFVFSQILPVMDVGATPYITFFLSSVIAWNAFSQGIFNGTRSLVDSMGLIIQVYFPREILVLVKMGETVVDWMFTFSAMLVINALVGVWPNANYVYLPLLFAIQIAFTLGLMFFLSYLTVMIRDIPQLVSVSLQLLFYLTPILYSASRIPEHLRFIVLINPLALLIDAYRSIIAYGTAPDPVNLYYPAVMACVLLYTGYIFFKANERRLADYV